MATDEDHFDKRKFYNPERQKFIMIDLHSANAFVSEQF